jgi:3-phenylpropionate/trans-cinnamate dioxygenase ferredoxin reductase subunit
MRDQPSPLDKTSPRGRGGGAERVVIVGANVAGGRAAETLRQAGFDGHIVLVGAEPDRPYERPPLSKEVLWNDHPTDKLFLRPEDFYAEQNIELRLGRRATRLDPHSRSVWLDDGEQLSYGKVLIATGASPRRLAAPGADLDGVLYLRDMRDALHLRERLLRAERVVVVGAGFIGAEVAASSRKLGREVVALEMLPVPLERALGRQVGELYADIHRTHGVDLRLNESVTALHGNGQVQQVETASGARIECDLVVVGVGVAPAVEWLEGSGIELRNGIVTDERCRTNLPDVFAAGDVANWWHPHLEQHMRVEHFTNAQNQGVAAAQSMLGQLSEPYAPVNYFWSDQYDVNLQYVGHASGEDTLVLRGDPRSSTWSAFYVDGNHLKAALAVNRYRDITAARQLIARRVPITAEVLADEGVDLRALARG